jgi:hypothetical protein
MARRVVLKTLVVEALVKQWMPFLIVVYMEESKDWTLAVEDYVLLLLAEDLLVWSMAFPTGEYKEELRDWTWMVEWYVSKPLA